MFQKEKIKEATDNRIVPEIKIEQITSPVEMKRAVLDIIARMPDNLNTHKFMLYILRVFDFPTLLEEDMSYIMQLENIGRQKRKMHIKIQYYLYVLLGLGLTAIGTYVLSLLKF